MCTVWIVMKHNSYDDHEIAAVCSTEEKARAVVQYYVYVYGMMEEGYSISEYAVDEEIQKSITALQHELDEINDLKNLLDKMSS